MQNLCTIVIKFTSCICYYSIYFRLYCGGCKPTVNGYHQSFGNGVFPYHSLLYASQLYTQYSLNKNHFCKSVQVICKCNKGAQALRCGFSQRRVNELLSDSLLEDIYVVTCFAAMTMSFFMLYK